MWMCGKHLREYQQDRLMVGWCDSCVAWGSAFTPSPCGAFYVLGG
jgi:hypothetical protein